MKRLEHRWALAIALGMAGCSPADPPAAPAAEGALAISAMDDGDPDCTFARGVTTCVSVAEHTEQSTHQAFSGCTAFDGTNFVPGRRVTTFLDTFEVTETTTTEQHGLRGAVFDTKVDVQRTLVSSTETGSVCEPL